jgi:UDP-N-acetylglucosamine--N-acetylmuramyl-(pentapeptide) pyrophosphoryl-undecaprenol N-acetylglucosamine transferase
VCVVFAGGGTGGHLVPGLAVAEELRRRLPDARCVFIGTKRPVEEHMVPRAGFELRSVDAPRMPERLHHWPFFPFRLWASIRRAKAALCELKPGIVVGLGGYGSAPVVLAAKKLGVPVVLMEQNTIPGRANRFLSRYAREVYAQFEASRAFFRDPSAVHVLGNPLRAGIAEGRRDRAMQLFSLDGARKTLLALGGSQGARTINQAVCGALAELAGAGPLQVIHQTGSEEYDAVAALHRKSGVRGYVSAFIDHMPEALAAADLVLSRAGATTLAEIAAAGKPSILVPYPFAADDHQRLNAQAYVDAGAAAMVRNSDLTAAETAKRVRALLFDEKTLRLMGRAARSLARGDASRDVCNHILVIMEGANS